MRYSALFTGALGVGIGLGLQRAQSLACSAAWCCCHDKSVIGDIIEVGGAYDWVSSLGNRYVAIETRDGTEFLIPNEDVITHQAIGESYNDERYAAEGSRCNCRANSDLDQVIALMREAATTSRPDPELTCAECPNFILRRNRDRIGNEVLDCRCAAWRSRNVKERSSIRSLAIVSPGKHSDPVL